MTLKSLISADVTSVLFRTNDFAETATVSRKSATVTMPAIVDTQEVQTRDNRDVMSTRQFVVLLIPVSSYNFGDGVTEPMSIDEFVIDSRRYEATSKDVNGLGRCWDYTDGTSQVYKIYVEEVKA